MAIILHQLGFRYQWNLDSITSDSTGDGFIAAPRYMSPEVIKKTDEDLRKKSFFDPQFFLPESNRGSLAAYPFFPEVVASGFETSEYSEEERRKSAEMCLKFQNDTGFGQLVIPVRYFEHMSDEFIDAQMELFIAPFIKTYRELEIRKPIFLQLILTDAMLKHETFRNKILNWVTGLDEIRGVYLIPQIVNRTHKQIQDISFLLALLKFIRALRLNEMQVAVGYLNTEAILLLAADPTWITMGSYENLRMFRLNAFKEAENQKGGPAARIYVSRLLQWINHEYIGAIEQLVDVSGTYFDESNYRINMFTPEYNWHFSKPEPYKHYFVVFAKQIRKIAQKPVNKRVGDLRKMLNDARKEHADLEKSGIVFDTDSSGDHLAPWLTALNMFEKEME